MKLKASNDQPLGPPEDTALETVKMYKSGGCLGLVIYLDKDKIA